MQRDRMGSEGQLETSEAPPTRRRRREGRRQGPTGDIVDEKKFHDESRAGNSPTSSPTVRAWRVAGTTGENPLLHPP